MNYELLGTSGLRVSRVGMGCWVTGGLKWGPVDDAVSIEAIKTAVGVGVNFFDTADYYGLGHSETILGRALGKDKRNVVIATKVGLRWNRRGKVRHDLSPGYIRDACEDSLRRLGIERIDLYQTHWPDPNTDFEASLDALEELVEAGKIRFFGGCNMSPALYRLARARRSFVSIQQPLNLLDLAAAADARAARSDTIGFIGYEPLAKGLLTGKFGQDPRFRAGDARRWDPRFSRHQLKESAPLLRTLIRISAETGISPAQTALALLLKKDGVTTVIPGARTADQIRENACSAELLTHPEIAERIARTAPPAANKLS